MYIEEIVASSQHGATFENLADSYGVSRRRTRIAASSLMEDLIDRIERQTISRGGLADFMQLLGDGAAGRALFDPLHLADPAIISSGDHVLDVLVGDKHVSRGFAARAARKSGLDVEVVKQMLPVVASMIVGGLQKQTQTLFPSQLRDVPGLGNISVDAEARAGGLLPLPGEIPPAQDTSSGGWGVELPRTGSSGGGVGGTTSGGVLLPLPGDNIPGMQKRSRYDDLSDVLRRGKVPAPGGGSLFDMLRSLLGRVLGFAPGGIIGSIIKILIVRWGWRILRSIFSRLFGR